MSKINLISEISRLLQNEGSVLNDTATIKIGLEAKANEYQQQEVDLAALIEKENRDLIEYATRKIAKMQALEDIQADVVSKRQLALEQLAKLRQTKGA